MGDTMFGYILLGFTIYLLLCEIHLHFTCPWKAINASKLYRYRIQEINKTCKIQHQDKNDWYEVKEYIVYRYNILFPFMSYPMAIENELENAVTLRDKYKKGDYNKTKIRKTWLKENQIVDKVL